MALMSFAKYPALIHRSRCWAALRFDGVSIVAPCFWKIQSLIGAAGPYEAIRSCSGNASPPEAPALNPAIGVMPARLAFASVSSSAARVVGGDDIPICAASFLL